MSPPWASNMPRTDILINICCCNDNMWYQLMKLISNCCHVVIADLKARKNFKRNSSWNVVIKYMHPSSMYISRYRKCEKKNFWLLRREITNFMSPDLRSPTPWISNSGPLMIFLVYNTCTCMSWSLWKFFSLENLVRQISLRMLAQTKFSKLMKQKVGKSDKFAFSLILCVR